MRKTLTILYVLGIVSSPASAAQFQNLGFDTAQTNITVPLPPDQGVGYGPAADLLPDWQLFQGTNQVSSIGYDLNPISLGVASLYDANPQGFPAPVSGAYSLGLYPGYNLLFQYQPFSLVQSGEIGANIQSIRFINFGSPFELQVNGVSIPLIYEYQPGNGNLDTRLAVVTGDVIQFAGQQVTLKFTTLDVPGSAVNGLDNLEFSTQIVPEPAAPLLLLVGLTAFVFKRPCCQTR
jgi:hypothetical protein